MTNWETVLVVCSHCRMIRLKQTSTPLRVETLGGLFKVSCNKVVTNACQVIWKNKTNTYFILQCYKPFFFSRRWAALLKTFQATSFINSSLPFSSKLPHPSPFFAWVHHSFHPLNQCSSSSSFLTSLYYFTKSFLHPSWFFFLLSTHQHTSFVFPSSSHPSPHTSLASLYDHWRPTVVDEQSEWVCVPFLYACEEMCFCVQMDTFVCKIVHNKTCLCISGLASRSKCVYVQVYGCLCVYIALCGCIHMRIIGTSMCDTPCHRGCQVVCHWVASVTLRCKRVGRGSDGGMVGGNRRREGVIERSRSFFLWSNIRGSCWI